MWCGQQLVFDVIEQMQSFYNKLISMNKQLPNYCQHFQHFKASSSLQLEKEASCKYCLQGNLIWMCLTKACGIHVCAKNNYQHLQAHHSQSVKIKKFHSIFINIVTAEIRCVKCRIEIGDLDVQQASRQRQLKEGITDKQDPFQFRLKVLPSLADLTTHRIVGQLQNSKGHQRVSRGLVGIFTNKYNYAINSAIQFIGHSAFIKQAILQMRPSPKNKILSGIGEMMKGIEDAQYRAIHSNSLSEELYKSFPQLLGYKRKDPFPIILHLLNIIDEATLFYSPYSQELDEWDLFYRKNSTQAHHLIYGSISSTISLNYYCSKCQTPSSIPQNIHFLKLNIPKKKRKAKQIEKELSAHRYSSPLKVRRNSLMSLFKQEEYPITVAELVIELMRSPLHKQINCGTCKQQLRKMKLHMQRLPDILLMKIARTSKQKDTMDETAVQLSTGSLDMGSFTTTPTQSVIYDFQSAICIEKGMLFPIVVVGESNKQKYVIRNEMVEMCKQKMNPYILCYKRRIGQLAKQKLTMIADDLKSPTLKQYPLPDFWYLQLQNGIERPLIHQLVCKHLSFKPKIQSKMKTSIYVSAEVYEDLLHSYNNNNKKRFPSLSKRQQCGRQQGRLVADQQCQVCEQQMRVLEERRKLERQYVLYYDRIKCQNLRYCMVSNTWIKKWSNFLYNHEEFAYMCKGYPLPGPIDNKHLLQGNKCKANLVKHQDFRVVNIYLWMFLKEVYGGGPQIRYKWAEGKQVTDQNLVVDIREKAHMIRQIYGSTVVQPGNKMSRSSISVGKSEQQQESTWQPYEQEISMQQS